MSIITFISDFGLKDHYVSSVKASIIKYNQNIKIVDISHNIRKYDISHAAHVFKNVYEEFPNGSIHIISVKHDNNDDIILFQLNNHFIITYNSGIISLIEPKESYNAILIDGNKHKTFSEKFMAEIALKLVSGINYTTLGSPTKDVRKFLNKETSISRNQIVGYILRIDDFGNFVTNISLSDFNKVLSQNTGSFEINVGGEIISSLSNSYSDVGIADIFAIFNYNQILEIGMNKGNASDLLGIREHDSIKINFL
ncbi:uncharacterized protein METZ01_LOCUS39506 [marine metagenome]|uniref:Uncharacterized protein n=1 Tax=marine metagenome TaxID=408172 RepID=A0A381R4L8_9ZZZZ